MSPLLDIKNLSVDIPLRSGMLHAVRGISFQAFAGKTLCLVGESGCGKSLTALALMDLLPASARRRAESLNFQGEDLQRLPEHALSNLRGNKIGMIFQDPMTSLNPAYTIGNQMTEVLRRHRKVSRKAARGRAVDLLEKVGITGAADRLRQYPHQLSGGLRQRVMIAMTLMCEPELLIADEPTTALDVTVQAEILSLLARLQKELNMAMILITHDLGVVARIADDVAVMYAGEIVESGSVDGIFNQPTHPYTQGLLNCIPVPGKNGEEPRLGTIAGLVPSLIGPVAGCAFHDRCVYAHAACLKTPVELISADAAGGHSYRCLLSVEQCAENHKRGANR